MHIKQAIAASLAQGDFLIQATSRDGWGEGFGKSASPPRCNPCNRASAPITLRLLELP
jgi:hypothetical protein